MDRGREGGREGGRTLQALQVLDGGGMVEVEREETVIKGSS